MNSDPIVEEIHKIREAHAEKFDNDLHKICEDARLRQQRENRTVVKRPARKPVVQPEVA
ncbi:MAG: hypothetical protein R3F02_02935 [Thiolinea sp.]